MARGKKTGGRQRGVPNRLNGGKALFNALKEKYDIDPVELLFLDAIDQRPCTRCDDDGLVTPLAAFYMLGSSSASAREQAVDDAEKGEMAACPDCYGSKRQRLDDGAQSRAIIRLVDSDLPKLSSIVYEDKSGLTMLSRMNAVSRMRQEALAKKMAEEEERARVERDS